MEETKPQLDWIHLPEGVGPVSLWESLHDGELRAMSSNLLDRTLRMEFDVGYLIDFHGLAEELTFIMFLQGVRSVRVVRWAAWPGGCSIPPGATALEQEKLVADYHAKWREESESWNTFVASIAGGDFEVSDATLVADDRELALKLGLMQDSSYFQVFVRAEKLAVSLSDGQPLSLAEFHRLGNEYWEAFAKRSADRGK